MSVSLCPFPGHHPTHQPIYSTLFPPSIPNPNPPPDKACGLRLTTLKKNLSVSIVTWRILTRLHLLMIDCLVRWQTAPSCRKAIYKASRRRGVVWGPGGASQWMNVYRPPVQIYIYIYIYIYTLPFYRTACAVKMINFILLASVESDSCSILC